MVAALVQDQVRRVGRLDDGERMALVDLVNDKFGVRLTDIVSQSERIEGLR